MKKFMNLIGLTIVIGIIIAGAIAVGKYLHEEDTRTQKEVYELLDKDYLSPDEKHRVDLLTDPDEMKEGFIMLDESHAKRYEYHFGKKR